MQTDKQSKLYNAYTRNDKTATTKTNKWYKIQLGTNPIYRVIITRRIDDRLTNDKNSD